MPNSLKIRQNGKKNFAYLGLVLTVFCHSQTVKANENIATLTQLQGEAKIFFHPAKSLPLKTESPRALFEGEYFEVKEAKVGDQIEKGSIFRTSPGSKARLIYPNGDQINVASASAYRVSWTVAEAKNTNATKAKTQINLMYGKLRGIIEKGGPRSRLQVKTKSAVMGVRGTDFFVEEDTKSGETYFSIIRGKVEVKSTAKNTLPVDIVAGYSLHIDTNVVTKAQPVPKLELQKTSQQEFVKIQKASSLASGLASGSNPAQNPPDAKIAQLETQASQTILRDIQKTDPTLYAALNDKNQKNGISIDDLNRAAMQTLFKEAPAAPVKGKPGQRELEKLEEGAYDKYFRIEE